MSDNIAKKPNNKPIDTSPILSARGLKKSFGDETVLKGIDFDLHRGECVCIIGPSGSGKSTFLRCLNYLEAPTSGEVLYDGDTITNKNARSIRKKLGMVFQHFNLINNLTVMENLLLAPLELETMTEISARRKALRLLHHIGLSDKKFDYPISLSGGQKQRIAIVRAMMMDPEVLLFDEPTSALDPESIGEVLELIRELADSGMTCIIVTHEMSFARSIASRIIFIDDGKIIEEGSPTSFFRHPKTERVKEFLKKVL